LILNTIVEKAQPDYNGYLAEQPKTAVLTIEKITNIESKSTSSLRGTEKTINNVE
jgi:hypothetical protein